MQINENIKDFTNYQDSGADHVICNNCEIEMYVPIGLEICPNCNVMGCMKWASEDHQEVMF